MKNAKSSAISRKVQQTRKPLEKFGVPKNTISMRTKNKEKLFSAPQATLSSTRKICNCNYKEEDKAVYDWFILRKSQLIPIDDALIKEEARFRQKVLNLQTSELHMG